MGAKKERTRKEVEAGTRTKARHNDKENNANIG